MSDKSERPIIAIGGPTAVGKTSAAIALARKVSGEVISADSAAVYRGVNIGTAKPSVSERQGIRFHLIDEVDPEEEFNVSRFKAAAMAAIVEIRGRDNIPIIVGGTGLYLRVLLEDYGLTSTPADSRIREELERRADLAGTAALHAELEESDPGASARIHPNDRKRIIRALEVLIRTGTTISAQQEADQSERKPLPACKFVLNVERETLNSRIGDRVEEQIAHGLEAEVRALLAKGLSPSLNSLRSLGYKEMAAYILGEIPYEDAVEAIKLNTRRFARRQLTWFRAERNWHWIDVTGLTPDQTAQAIIELLPQT